MQTRTDAAVLNASSLPGTLSHLLRKAIKSVRLQVDTCFDVVQSSSA